MGRGVKMDEGIDASAGVACVAVGSWAAVACITMGVWTAAACTVTGSLSGIRLLDICLCSSE